MKHKLEDYPKAAQSFVAVYKRMFWCIGGLNTEHSALLDWGTDLNKFSNYDTELMYQMYRAGKRQANKENRIKLKNLFKHMLQ